MLPVLDDPRATIRLEPPARPERPPTDTLQLGELIGEGSMGHVVAAWQPCLARNVAVKRPRDGGTGWSAAHLRLEARATGLLEHPNIVPVHDLREGDDGPWMVMKQIAGESWEELVDHPERCAPYLEGRDLLAFHLGVLVAVCRALAFAHERGVLHRDVKPSNVMVGRFGEVYLLDWGIAVALREGLGLPLASEQRQPAGSPAFMAPEMARGDGPAQDVRTDVYLLGATLYYALTGRPFHPGASIREVLGHARDGHQALPTGVPRELVELVDRCTRPDPAERPASADEVRLALSTFLRHRDAARVVAEAERRALEVRRLVEAELAGGAHTPGVHTLSVEARFGYRQGLEVWPDNRRALDGLARLQRTMFDYELFRENADAAELLLEELGEPTELAARLDELRARRAEQAGAAEELARRTWEEAPEVSAGARTLVGLLMGIVSSALLFGLGWADRRYGVGWPEMLAAVGVFSLLGLVGAGVSILRPTNRLGHAHAAVTAGMALVLPLHWVSSWAVGASVWGALCGAGVLSGCVLVVLAWVGYRSVLVGGLAFLATVPAILAWPAYAFEIAGTANAVAFFAYAAISYASARRRV